MKPSSLIGLAGLIAGAIWLGRCSAPSGPPAPTARAPEVATREVATRPTSSLDQHVWRAEPRAAQPALPAAAIPEETEPATEAEEQARGAALDLIADASGRGRWTADDWTRFDDLLGAVAPERRQDTLEMLAATINEGGMTLEPHP